MSTDLTPQEIINSALHLPLAEREQVIDALQESLIDKSVDHGPDESTGEVLAAWSDEIARRISDVDSGRIKTISAEDAEKMIRDNVRPQF